MKKYIEANVLIGNLPDSDFELFFGPIGTEQCLRLEEAKTWADVLAFTGVFPSKSQARKNGWDKPIESGYAEVKVGKLKNWICVLKEWEDLTT